MIIKIIALILVILAAVFVGFTLAAMLKICKIYAEAALKALLEKE